MSIAYAHCDIEVVHSPGTCQDCDNIPSEQAKRAASNYNFTGENDPAKAPCPHDLRMAKAGLGPSTWYGNVPNPSPTSHTIKLIHPIKFIPVKFTITNDKDYNDICLKCNSPAYRGFSSFECSKGCK